MHSAAPDTSDPSLKATRREWIGLAILALPCLVYAMDFTVLNLAIPALTAELRPSASQLLWIIDVYGFMVSGFLMIMGGLGDRIGRRKVLLLGAAAFGAVSILAAFSKSAQMLIFARAALGVAGATLAPSTLSLLANMFRDPSERTFAVSMWISSFSAGAIIGPLVGGALIQSFGWGSVFLAGVPVMVLLLVLGPVLLPEYRDPNAGRLDLASALLSLAAVLSFVYGLKRAAEAGFGADAIGAMAAGVALALLFLRRQARLEDPLIDLALFRSRSLNTALCINMLGVFFMFGAFILLAQYFQLVAGLTPLDAGLWSTPSAIVFMIGSFATPALARRIRPVNLLAGGLIVAAAGFVGLALAGGFYGVFLSSLLLVGFTPVIALTTEIIVTSAPPERAGAASALSETAIELGGALGIAALGSLGTLIYRAKMAGVIAGLPADVARAAGATLGGAADAVKFLPPEQAERTLSAARDAFCAGFQAIALLSALGLVGAAFATKIALKQARHPSAEGAGEKPSSAPA
ncbi:MFS transporter [Methylocystis rosea]|uniref:MFS transporter n=1 Tax=Methylocystis rosea TaxID=173366 RepID=A0A3G8M445_9HYPH|nr:MFS transporter [Methylocystis rosea]AZG76701.1 MFS transporter [Methylocystis rosea]